MTTQSPHLYSRQSRPTVESATAAGSAGAGKPGRGNASSANASSGNASSGNASSGNASSGNVQTSLPWWAVALPALAFAALLALLSGGTADASTAASSGDLLGHIASSLPDLVQRLL
ncbi:hypothetical protein ABZX65_02630 [Streptomyces sp. NPDC003300]|uniref:hypothetical protein n=1 Tax=unclassified Streptomyces TaxID=2593676 RepID=UPI0033BD1B95